MRRVLPRREVLALLGGSAGAALAAACAPGMLRRGRRLLSTLASPSAALAGTPPDCVVRPEQMEGPYFVDERLLRSDIREDPSDGSISDGARLALTIVVSRVDGTACTPLPGVLVDLWHCDAAGIYSDVQDPAFDTRGRKFLRGYQLTDAGGAASFVTIYPGWYTSRAVHVHFKIRTDPDSATGFDFTSQLYFDDLFTDGVYAAPPYVARGERAVRNEDDLIFQGGGDQLVLDVQPDGMGGYATTFRLGVEIPSGGPTTTTVPGGQCDTIEGCVAALETALPDPAAATDAKTRRTARRLRRRFGAIARLLGRATEGAPSKQARRYARAADKLAALRAASQAADARGTLGADLPSIEAAVTALSARIS
jgi:protocatechuate 3,4-dioxygenase beta subunit